MNQKLIIHCSLFVIRYSWFLRTVSLGHIFIDVLVFSVTVLDDRVHQIRLIDRCNFKQDRRYVLIDGRLVVVKRFGVELLFFREFDRGFDGGGFLVRDAARVRSGTHGLRPG